MNNRRKYVDNMKANLDQWTKNIDDVETKLKDAPEAIKADYQRQLQELQNKRDEANKKLQELVKASGGAWKELKNKFGCTLHNITHAFGSAKSKVFGK